MPEGWEDFSIDGGGGVEWNIPPTQVETGESFLSFVPVNWLMGKELDELTQRGVAIVLLTFVCLLALSSITFYVFRTWRRNRTGYRGTLRRVAKGDFSKCKKVE